MNLIKLLYWFIGIHVLAQPLQCKVGDYYCTDIGRCITKGVVCKNSCDMCLNKQNFIRRNYYIPFYICRRNRILFPLLNFIMYIYISVFGCI